MSHLILEVIYLLPREARKISRSGVYHLMLRGINQQTIFEEDEDKLKFLETLKKYKKITGFELYGYCLMDNHVHLLIKEGEEAIANVIKRVSSSYVYWYNMKYQRVGHLFQERFKSENVEDDRYFFTALRYIHQNPLKAGLAKDIFTSMWTSMNEYMRKGELVDIDRALNQISSDRKAALKWFIHYMQESNKDQCLEYKVRFRLSDNQVRIYLHEMGISNNSLLQRMDRENRDAVLLQIKKLEGVTIRQISRITGISKSVIDRIGT